MILIFLVMMMAGNLQADETQCRAVLHDCDSALKAEQAENALQKQIIKDQTTVNNDLQSQIKTESLWKPLFFGALTAAVIEGLLITIKK